ncbi:MAG: hypothetical protein MJE68_00090, partial [Proteobacteria bacterium]|nr:hypothetical protein [Pseudomonadota bacterium]
MRLRFTETVRDGSRWRRQSGRSHASGGSTSSDSESLGPYTGPSEPVILPEPPTKTPSLDAVQVKVAGVKFVGGASDSITNPLYDREQKKNIEPPQWRKENLLQNILGRDEPISYVKGTKATVKLDITGSGETPVWVKVTPRATLLKKTLLVGGGETVSADPKPMPVVFQPASRRIEVTDWNAPDYETLTFKTNRLPNEVRLSELGITWGFEWGRTENGPWHDAGVEPTSHETYITYARSYREFLPHRRPWKEALRRACFYAHGADTELRVSKGVTTGIYNSREFDYSLAIEYNKEHTHSYRDIVSKPPLFGIYLWRMLLDGWVDCRDGSNYYTILMRWLGIDANQIRINGTFFYNPLLPISKNPNPNDDARWVEDSWRFHQVGILG